MIEIEGKPFAMPGSVYDLERLICKFFGLDAFPKDLGEHMHDESYYTSALMPPDEEGVRDCIRESRRYLAARGQLDATGGQVREIPTSIPASRTIGARDEARAEFLSSHMADLARERHEVREFRKRHFRGRPISAARARAVLESHATRFLPHEFFAARKIPSAGHTTQILGPDGKLPVSWDESVFIRIVWGAGEHHDEPYQRHWFFDIPDSTRRVAIPRPGLAPELIPVSPWSVLDEVRVLSERLAAIFPWRAEQAVWFLLTDETPTVAPISFSLRARGGHAFREGTITLFVEPWVAADSVLATYQHLQKTHFATASGGHAREQYLLFDFVQKFRREQKGNSSWENIRMAWNQSGSGRKYVSSRSVRRAYEIIRAFVEGEVLYPRYRVFEDSSPSGVPQQDGRRKRASKLKPKGWPKAVSPVNA